MQIESIAVIPGVSGFFFDDQQAIKANARADGFGYDGAPRTPGFRSIRQAGEALLVDLTLSDGSVVSGDCAAVQYSGAGGRDPLFIAAEYASIVEGPVADALIGRGAAEFETNTGILESLTLDGSQLHTAIRYGVSQALTAAAARARQTTMTDVFADSLGTDPATEPIPVFGQSGDDRRTNAEKMLLKGVPVLPHGLFNSPQKVGAEGERLREYIAWLSTRASELGPYEPTIHIDVYGTIGDLFGPPYDRPAVITYLQTLAAAAAPCPLQLEGPMDTGSREAQIRAMAELRDGLDSADVAVDIVADEWCNTLEDIRAFVDAGAADLVQVKTPDLGGIYRSGQAVMYCAGTDTRAYLGGTCNETATSARVCAQLALATNAAQVLGKPGMGFDEGYMIVENEMRRTIARRGRQSTPAEVTTSD